MQREVWVCQQQTHTCLWACGLYLSYIIILHLIHLLWDAKLSITYIVGVLYWFHDMIAYFNSSQKIHAPPPWIKGSLLDVTSRGIQDTICTFSLNFPSMTNLWGDTLAQRLRLWALPDSVTYVLWFWISDVNLQASVLFSCSDQNVADFHNWRSFTSHLWISDVGGVVTLLFGSQCHFQSISPPLL